MAKPFRQLQEKRTLGSRTRVENLVKELKATMPLNILRQARKLTQVELAESMETTQANISKLEKRTDMYISTLRNYIQGMGGELKIIAHFPDGDVSIKKFERVK